MRRLLETLQCPPTLIAHLTRPSYEDLKLAIWRGDLGGFQGGLSQGAPTHGGGQNILHFATVENKYEFVEWICSNKPELVDDKDEDGYTALMLAIFLGFSKIAKILVEKSDLNLRDSYGNTAFIIASANGVLEIVEMLFERSHSTKVKNFEGQTALHRACYYGELEVVRFLNMKVGLKFGTTDKNGNSCLHLAAMGCSIIVMRYIILKVRESGALLQSPNKENKKPMQILEEVIEKINAFKGKKIDFREVNDYVLAGVSMQL